MASLSQTASPQAVAGSVRGWMLAFVAGYVDVVGFAALFGLFTAHVTGNFIMIGIELAGASEGLVSKLLALPMFVLAVACTRFVETSLRRRGRPVVSVLFAAESVLLIGFMAAGLSAAKPLDPNAPLVVITGLLAVAAMGIQNALSRTALSEVGPTTIMTGNTTQIVIDVVDLAAAGPEQKAAIKRRLGKMATAVVGFAAGAILGALAYAALSFWAAALPVAVLTMLAVQLRHST